MIPVLDAFDSSPHSIAKIAPNKANIENEIQVLMNIDKGTKKIVIILN
jgi:hypothetical protein